MKRFYELYYVSAISKRLFWSAHLAYTALPIVITSGARTSFSGPRSTPYPGVRTGHILAVSPDFPDRIVFGANVA